MTVEEILELMDELLDKSSSVPFSQKKMILTALSALRELLIKQKKNRRPRAQKIQKLTARQ